MNDHEALKFLHKFRQDMKIEAFRPQSWIIAAVQQAYRNGIADEKSRVPPFRAESWSNQDP